MRTCHDNCCEERGMDKKEVTVKESSASPEATMTVEVTNEYVLNFAFISFVLFTFLQFIFALTARSQSMLTDCAAMTVDCVSYLINYVAERLKHNKDDDNNNDNNCDLSAYERNYRKKMRLLLLELAPPFISVATLVAVTIIAIQQAVEIILDTNLDDKGPQPNLFLMLLFSAMNFVLDGVNMMCFSRADQAKGLSEGITAAMHPQVYVHDQDEKHKHHHHKRQRHPCNNNPLQSSSCCPAPTSASRTTVATEKTHLLGGAEIKQDPTVATTDESDDEDLLSNSSQSSRGLNLNMCSAWTHICADTLRSIAVLIAAGFAWLFPQLLTPADADSWGAIVVSIIIIFSLAPLIEGLYFTGWEIYHLYSERQRRCQQGEEDAAVVALAV